MKVGDKVQVISDVDSDESGCLTVGQVFTIGFMHNDKISESIYGKTYRKHHFVIIEEG